VDEIHYLKFFHQIYIFLSAEMGGFFILISSL